jgi:hypothetical protein
LVPENQRWRLPVGSCETDVVYERAGDPRLDALLILAHGAGGHMAHRSITDLAAAIRAVGIDVARFNFPYRAAGKGPPDRMPKLLACYAAVLASVRERVGPNTLLIGGHSMGGRAASMLAAQGCDCDGLILLSYPLHPPRQPDRLRQAHLPCIKQPVLCLNGTRDALCTRELMDPIVADLTGHWTMHWIEGADHAYQVLKRSGRAASEILSEIGATCACWINRCAKDR